MLPGLVVVAALLLVPTHVQGLRRSAGNRGNSTPADHGHTANATTVAVADRQWRNVTGAPGHVLVNTAVTPAGAPQTFQSFYNAHTSGRGVWKWSNALDAYQRHFAPLAGQVTGLAEVGVQSGGSILMWKAVLGPQCHIFGIDINPACRQFADDTTTITIGDQGDAAMWNAFYTASGASQQLDILLDDGGHQPTQMGTTLHLSFPHMKPGGIIAIEDIFGPHYLQQFLFPAAQSIGAWNAQWQVASVHIYPGVLIVHKAGAAAGRPTGPAPVAAVQVTDFPQLWAAVPQHPGAAVALENPAWGSLLTENALKGTFNEFGPLWQGDMWDNPPGCATTPAPVCTSGIHNSQVQAHIIGVHIFPTRLIAEVAATPPLIQAVRKGTEWIPYR